MEYSKKFERDFKWYLYMRYKFNFDGSSSYTKKEVIVSEGVNLKVINNKDGSFFIDNVDKEIRYSYNSFINIFPHLINSSKNLNINYSKGMFKSYAFNIESQELIKYSKEGFLGKEAFYIYDSTGKIVVTKHPNILKTLYKTKGSVNLHIQMYAEDRANLRLSGLELRGLCIKFKAPSWFREAINNQAIKLGLYDKKEQS
jgi:hypothetical protein